MDVSIFNGTFWLSMTTLIIGFLTGVSVYCLKSKCKNCSICFGLVKVERDVELEEKFEEVELEKGINPFANQNNETNILNKK